MNNPQKKKLITSLLSEKYGDLKGGEFPCGACCTDKDGNDICNVSDAPDNPDCDCSCKGSS